VTTIKTGSGPEDIAFDESGRMYSGLANGQIIRRNSQSDLVEEWVNTGGRPLGLVFNNQGDLIVADAKKGLLSINDSGQIKVLASAINGIPFKFIDDLVVADNGVVYFVDSSKDYGIEDDYVLNSFMDGRPLGRLLSYDPHSKKVAVIHDKLFFPNGCQTSTTLAAWRQLTWPVL
jgi:sugar lactone lactonase YvrE